MAPSTASDEQLALDAMPKRLYAVTPTKLANWSDCPRKFRFTYLERRPRTGAWGHNTVGAVVHAALKQWWDLPPAQRTGEAGTTLVIRGWVNEGFRDDAQSLDWRGRAAAMTSRYLASVDPQRQPIGIERTVAAPIGPMALSGRVDRIDERPKVDGVDNANEVVIVDYKTGRTPLTDDDARTSQALALYAVAARRTLRRECKRVELHHLPTAYVAAWDHTDESLQRQIVRAENVTVDAAHADELWKAGLDTVALRAGESDAGVNDDVEVDAVLPPRPGNQCGWCDFRQWCKVGRDAAPAKQRWAGLAD